MPIFSCIILFLSVLSSLGAEIHVVRFFTVFMLSPGRLCSVSLPDSAYRHGLVLDLCLR